MDSFEYKLRKKAAKYANVTYGYCDTMKKIGAKDSELHVIFCNSERCDKFDECNIATAYEAYFDGMKFMLNKIQPLILGRVVGELVDGVSPYQDNELF